MAPRLFPQFRKLPPELRVRIWRSLMLPRIIRGKWQSRRFCKMNVSIYILYAGPVPVTLCVDSESRFESQKHYSLIRCLLPLRPLPSEERDGEKLAPAPRQEYLFEVASIWVNCNIDTCFFHNFPSNFEFLSWFRRLSKPSVGGLAVANPLRHIALTGVVCEYLRATGRTDVLYSLCMEHPQLETITVVLDNSKFVEDRDPQAYKFRETPSLAREDRRGGGPWGGWLLRSHVKLMFDKFWEGNPKVKGCEKWVAWREMNPQWKEPAVKMVSISKAQRETLKSRMEKEAALAKILGAEEDADVTSDGKAVHSRKAAASRKAVARRKISGTSKVPTTKKAATSRKVVARKNRAAPVKVATRKVKDPAR
ncbi:hypothetical protein BUE80_DR008353 [Diplocarpon rosae]|nr:hypothetical protein BUE80_DR008353 [Diplocarpon rosae]